jgi:hypothetical protein
MSIRDDAPTAHHPMPSPGARGGGWATPYVPRQPHPSGPWATAAAVREHPYLTSPPQPCGPATATGTNRWAIVSLITALLGLVPVAVGAGVVALTQVRVRNELGRGMAIAGIAVSGGVALAVGLVTGGVFVWQSSGSTDVEAEGTTSAVAAQEVGDCFDAVVGESSSVDAVNCATPHDGEVYHLGALAEGSDSFTGDTDIALTADEQCYDAFEHYVGRDLETSAFSYAFFAPDEQSWAEGDRAVACAIMPSSLGSLEGSGS